MLAILNACMRYSFRQVIQAEENISSSCYRQYYCNYFLLLLLYYYLLLLLFSFSVLLLLCCIVTRVKIGSALVIARVPILCRVIFWYDGFR